MVSRHEYRRHISPCASRRCVRNVICRTESAVGFAVDGQDLAMEVGGGVHPALEGVTVGGGRTMRSLLYR